MIKKMYKLSFSLTKFEIGFDRVTLRCSNKSVLLYLNQPSPMIVFFAVYNVYKMAILLIQGVLSYCNRPVNFVSILPTEVQF